MNKKKILILGANGMLGNAIFRSFYGLPNYAVTATVRSVSSLKYFSAAQRSSILCNIDVLNNDSLITTLNRTKPDVVINCVGLIKQLPSVNDPLATMQINSVYPHRLARLTGLCRARLIHISTDCVFSGSSGNYSEDSVADATDLYGVSKYLGETVNYSNAITLRTSIIGRELNSSNSLVDWFLAQENEVMGYGKAIFSGLPTCELARVVRDFVLPNGNMTGLFHVSANPISKYELLQLIAKQYKKYITVIRDEQVVIDRSLNASKFMAATSYVAPAWPELIMRMHNTDLTGDNNVR